MTKYILALLASAVIMAPSYAKGLYVSTYGGANWDSVNIDKGWFTAKAEDGYVMGVSIGTHVDSIPGLRVEGELNYRSSDVRTFICDNPLIVTDQTWAIMANAVYDVPVVIVGLHPYALVGVGYGSRTAGVDYSDNQVSNQGVAWQVGAGVNTQVAEGVTVGIGYRYFDAPDLDHAPGGFHEIGGNQSVLMSVTFALD
jgi:opacity protein-like surface antigen